MKPTQHTPTHVETLKVRAVKYGDQYTAVIETHDGKYIGEISGIDNSQTIEAIDIGNKIVRAVNAHEELLACAKLLEIRLRIADNERPHMTPCVACKAIAKAEGK